MGSAAASAALSGRLIAITWRWTCRRAATGSIFSRCHAATSTARPTRAPPGDRAQHALWVHVRRCLATRAIAQCDLDVEFGGEGIEARKRRRLRTRDDRFDVQSASELE